MLLACTDLALGQNLFIFTRTVLMPGSSDPKPVQLKFLNFILIPSVLSCSVQSIIPPNGEFLDLGVLIQNSVLN